MKKCLVSILILVFAVNLVFSACSKQNAGKRSVNDVSVEWDKVDLSSLNENGGELKFNVSVKNLKEDDNENGIKIKADIVIAYRNTKGEISKYNTEETFSEFGTNELRYQVNDLTNYNGVFIENVKCTVTSYEIDNDQ